MVSMRLVMLFAVLCSCSSQIPPKNPKYDIPIRKNLNNGDNFIENEVLVNLEGRLENDAYHLYVTFDYNIPEIPKIESLTVYLTTEQQEISEIIFTEGKMECKSWKKPWNPASNSPFSKEDLAVHPMQTAVEVPRECIPKSVITGISASIQGTLDDNTPITLNYYGLKNYLISLPDRYVVKNYMPVDLDVFVVV